MTRFNRCPNCRMGLLVRSASRFANAVVWYLLLLCVRRSALSKLWNQEKVEGRGVLEVKTPPKKDFRSDPRY